MSYEDIVRDYSEFPQESIPDVLRFAAAVTDRRNASATSRPWSCPEPSVRSSAAGALRGE